MESSNSPNKAIIAIVVVALLVAAATAVIVLSSNNTTKEEPAASVSPSTSATPSSSTSLSSLRDGTYTATGNYQTPGGQESIGVTVTLAGGSITNASVDQQGKTGEAQEFQAQFASGFKSQVVGKSIEEVSLTRVAGSSLTPNGFNDAINDIENQAKA